MRLEHAIALYRTHRKLGESPSAFFRRTVLATHPDKVSAPRCGLPSPHSVLEARAIWRSFPLLFENKDREEESCQPSSNSSYERCEHQQENIIFSWLNLWQFLLTLLICVICALIYCFRHTLHPAVVSLYSRGVGKNYTINRQRRTDTPPTSHKK